jgi:sugar phosphate isomerase/epimerase
MLPLGIYSWFGYKLSFRKRLEMIAAAGFTVTSVWFGEEEDLVREGRTEEMPAIARERGLALDNIHAPFWNSNLLWSDSNDQRQIIRKEITEAITYCERHQIPITVMHLCGGETPPTPNETGLRLLHDLVKIAEDNNVTIALENLEYAGNRHLDFVFSNIESANLGFCYDSSHDNIAREFKQQALTKWGHLLATTHISDNLGTLDDHFLPGKGNIHWPEVMKSIPKNYQGAFLLEVDNPNAGKSLTPEDFLQQAYKQASRLSKMVG